VVKISKVVRHRELAKEQRVEEPNPVEVDGVKEWEVEKILNKRKVRGVMKYLVYWKGFTAENDICEKEEDLENVRKAVDKFEERISAETVRHSSHRSGSPQNRLRDEQTCGMTLASAYVLRRLSATWLQLQMKGRKSEWK